jgi:hypothetical protein
MAHFAKINNNIVEEVIVVNNNVLLDEQGVEQESKGVDFCKSLFEGDWIQTSYNGNFRKQFAGMGFEYNKIRDAFVAPQPFPSWTLDENLDWQAPVEKPEGLYYWDENSLSWLEG